MKKKSTPKKIKTPVTHISKATADKILRVIKEVRKTKYWINKHGDETVIEDMETQHIKNCIVMLSKAQNDYTALKLGNYIINEMTAAEWVEIFRDELEYREVHDLKN
jgi:hypothetical protein